MQRVGIEGQLLGHEADLDDRADAILQQAIVDLIDIGKVVDRVAVLVLVVDSDLVMQDGVKAHIAKSVTCFTARRSSR